MDGTRFTDKTIRIDSIISSIPLTSSNIQEEQAQATTVADAEQDQQHSLFKWYCRTLEFSKPLAYCNVFLLVQPATPTPESLRNTSAINWLVDPESQAIAGAFVSSVQVRYGSSIPPLSLFYSCDIDRSHVRYSPLQTRPLAALLSSSSSRTHQINKLARAP